MMKNKKKNNIHNKMKKEYPVNFVKKILNYNLLLTTKKNV